MAPVSPEEMSRLARIRRYAVPRWMIERATERRLAGDWRGACAAANVEVTFEPADVAREYGAEAAAALEDDLLHFAPDLLRWHLPRPGRGRTTITPSQEIVLGRGEPDGPRLSVGTPRWMAHGPQRLRLNFAPVHLGEIYLETDWHRCAFWRNVAHVWSTARHLWDARYADELRERCGGGKDRAPFFEPDGTPRSTAGRPGDDPAARTERITLLHEAGEVVAAFAAAGIELDESAVELTWPGDTTVRPAEVLAAMPLALTRLEPEIRRLAAELSTDRFWVPHTQHVVILIEAGETALRVRLDEFETGDDPEGAVLPEAFWRRLPDLDLVRAARTPLEHLHPLVRDALFPAHRAGDAPAGPPGPEPQAPVRVRCRGEWHEVVSGDGGLRIPHGQVERDRERALRALGGGNAGCFALEHTWRTGVGRLPRSLGDRRREMFARAQHGDTPGVLELLDLGFDPHVRNERQRTLLHLIHLLDHEPLLPRLLAAGLDVNAADEERRTPLFLAICEEGSTALVRALLAAGARIDVVGEIHGAGMSLHRLIDWNGRGDLDFLSERIEREHPELTEDDE